VINVCVCDSMKKVSSGSQLSDMVKTHHNRVSHVPQSKIPKSSSDDSLRTRAFVSEVSPPPEASSKASDIMYAVVSKGLASSQCLADISELETAPDIRVSETDITGNLASCLATEVIPDEGNGELITTRAAELESESAKNVTMRYAKEITSAAAEGTRRLSRKRSLDGSQELPCEDVVDRQVSQKVSDLPPEGKELLSVNLQECSAKNTLDVDDD